MNELHSKAKTIFLEAIGQESPDSLLAFLEVACAGDPALRAAVDQLLRAHGQAGNFLGGLSEPATKDDSAHTERPGTTIGPYKIVEQIGEGGFGIVFLAQQQQPVRRNVALKVLKPGMDSRHVIARFEAERQALALMDHPHIARVLDAGQTQSGRPYFVMELVKGIPITRYCDQQRLTPRERLELFLPVCMAVQHAHQKGIIHRDLKPNNVLVASYDGRPLPKVIDFGVAKALGQQLTDRTLVTGFGGIIGTLEYMSPEQAEFNARDVDTRADIYSLGVLLYELLTGSTPLTKERLNQAAVSEVLRLIREDEPPKPSTRISDSKDSLALVSAQRKLEPARLTREVRGELDWIVMKCLEKDRARRYETANGLARDIERYLHDEPVEASPPSGMYRLRKFTRKHRKWLGTATAFMLLLAVGAAVSTGQALRARAAERQAVTARDAQAEQLELAKQAEARAQAVLKFFQDKVLSAVRPKGQEGGLGKDATIRAALDQAEPEIAASFANQPLVEASIRNTLGVSYWYLDANEIALRQQERALELRRQVFGPEHPETVGAMNDVAIILHTLGRFDEAHKLFAEAVEVKRRTLGPEDPVTLRSVNNLANILAEQGDFEEAIKLTEETMQIQRRVEGPENIFTLRSTYNLAIMLRHAGEIERAGKLFDEALRVLTRVYSSDHQDTLRVMNEYAEFLLDQGERAEAQKILETTLEAKRRVLGDTHIETLIAMADLADALRANGQVEKASKLAAEAAELHRRICGPEHPQTVVAQTILANVYRDQGKFSESRKLYGDTLALARRILGPKTPETQHLMDAFAWMLATATDPAFRDAPRAIELAKEAVDYAPKHANYWSTLGVAYYQSGNWDDTVAALKRSESISPGIFIGVNGLFLAMAEKQLGDDELARVWYDKAMHAMSKSDPMAQPCLSPFRVEAERLLSIAH